MARPPNRPNSVRTLPEALNGDGVKGRQLREHLQTMIKTLSPGALLPSERVLAERLHVARGTVRTQIDALAAEGLIRRVPGRGTFVAEPRMVQTERMSSFSRDMLARGMTPSSRILSVRVKPSTQLIAEKLEIPVETPVVAVARIRYADDEPMALERAHLPATLFPGLERVDLNKRSLYEVLSSDYGRIVDSADQRISVVSLGTDDARRLGTEAGSPAFDIERLTRDRMGTPVEWGHAILRGDRYDILMHVEA